jgi:hypothetical protein
MRTSGIRPLSQGQLDALKMCRTLDEAPTDDALGWLVASAAAAIGRRFGRTVPEDEVQAIVGFAVGAAVQACPQVLPQLVAPRP